MSDVKKNDISDEKESDNDKKCRAEDLSDEYVDPRIQVELECLNTATDLINKYETELDDARSSFRVLLSESSIRVNQLAKKIGSCVEKSRPYYEARMRAKQLQTQTQKAALRYERSSSAHSAAKEMVFLAEEGLIKEGKCFDPAWQEMLNHATLRVNESENERVLSQHEHQKTSMAYNEAEKHVQQLHQDLRKSIMKSSLSTRRSLLQLNNLANQHQLQLLPYFEMKAQFNQLLEEQRKKVHHLEEHILKTKMNYSDALHNLEEISDEIHEKRKMENMSKNGSISESSAEDLKYHRLRNSSSISKSISFEEIQLDDEYMSLPSNITLTPGMIPQSIGDHSEEINDRGSNISNEFSYQMKSEKRNGINSIPSDLLDYQAAASCQSDYLSHSLKSKDEACGAENVSCEKLFASDLKVLRIQREEMSDSESVASNDTLDDNQIECLLLEKLTPLDIS